MEKSAVAQGLNNPDNFVRGGEKDETAHAHLAKFCKMSGVILIGESEVKPLGFKARRLDHETKVWLG